MLQHGWSKILLIAILAVTPTLAGCEMQRFHSIRQENMNAAKSHIKMGSHDVTVVPGSDVTAHSEMIRSNGERLVEHFEYNVGETLIVIEDEKLYVNQKFYGQLATGDSVHIEHERVNINGRPVEVRHEEAPPAPRKTRPVKLPAIA